MIGAFLFAKTIPMQSAAAILTFAVAMQALVHIIALSFSQMNLDHSPYLYEDIAATGADLQLSGHVHAAQLFPLHLLYSFVVDHIYGDYRVEDTAIYVSAGISGWCFPLRSEAHCTYEVICLNVG